MLHGHEGRDARLFDNWTLGCDVVAAMNPWFRMYTEFAEDPKVQMMPEAMQRRLVMLFCLRCRDVTVTLRDDEIAFSLRISDAELAETKALFVQKGFIENDWSVRNWDKRQFVSDSSAARTRAYRAKLRDVDVTSPKRHSDALDTDTDTDKKRSKEGKGAASPLPVWLPENVWADWHSFRNSRKGWTAKARELSLRTLTDLHERGFDPRAVVNQSIERGWTGLFPIRNGDSINANRESPAERVARINAEAERSAAGSGYAQDLAADG